MIVAFQYLVQIVQRELRYSKKQYKKVIRWTISLCFGMRKIYQVKRIPIYIVNCWIEDWEAKATSTYNPVYKAKLLRKYSGLEWIDIDNNVLCHAGDTLKWLGKCQMGWNVIGYTENWVETDPNQHWDYWSIFKDCPLHDCLLEYYHTKKKSA